MKKGISKLALSLLLPISVLTGCNQSKGYTITWVDEDGTVLEIDKNVKEGEMPSYDSDIPSKPGDEHYDYEFMNWYTAVMPVSKNETYTAQYQRNPQKGADGLDIDPLDLAIKAGKALIENFVSHGKQIISVVTAIIGCFSKDEQGKKVTLDDIKGQIDSLRDELTEKFQEIESELASLSEQQRQIEERLEKLIVDQTVLSSKAKDFDTLLTTLQEASRQISVIENTSDEEMSPQNRSFELARLIGSNEKWLDTNNIFNQCLNLLTTLTGNTFGDIKGRDLLTIINDQYSTEALFTGEAKHSTELYFNQVLYLAFYAYSIISQCLKGAEDVATFTAEDVAKLSEENQTRYQNREIATLYSIITEETEYLNRKVFQIDFEEPSLTGRIDAYYDNDDNRHIFINKGTANINMKDDLIKREYKDAAFVKDGSEYDSWSLDTFVNDADHNATFDASMRLGVVNHVKANFNGTMREYLTALGYDLTNVPENAYYYIEIVITTEDGEMDPHTAMGYYYIIMGYKAVNIDDKDFTIIDQVVFSKTKAWTTGQSENIPVDGGYFVALINA